MENTIIVAIIGLVGTLFGSIIGAYSGSSKSISDLRLDVKGIQTEIETLSKRVEKHNNFAERIPVLEEQIKVANHRIEDLEKR
jgi:peptidoglycan hydrolase CwlO-like protein